MVSLGAIQERKRFEKRFERVKISAETTETSLKTFKPRLTKNRTISQKKSEVHTLGCLMIQKDIIGDLMLHPMIGLALETLRIPKIASEAEKVSSGQ